MYIYKYIYIGLILHFAASIKENLIEHIRTKKENAKIKAAKVFQYFKMQRGVWVVILKAHVR
jgi:hypothetical protein